MASNYDFRILINTVSGSNISYGTSSLVSVQPNTSLVVNTDTMVDKINTMKRINVFNGKSHTTASSLFNQINSTQFSGSTGTDTNYQFVSASIKGSSDSGSILFHVNSTPTAGGDYTKRYKFFGNKVCNVLGVPENYWIYADKFRFTNTGSEQNYISGDVLAQSLHLRDNFAISNAGAIESDLPMKHAKDTDRWIKWTDVSSSIPQNDMLIGYSNQNDRYEIRMQNEDLLISSSATTASGDFKVDGNLEIGGTFSPSSVSTGTITATGMLIQSSSKPILEIRNDAETEGGIRFTDTQALSSQHFEILFNCANNTGSGENLRFNSAINENILYLNEAGRVGINTQEPSEALEVVGNISASGNIDGNLGKFYRDDTFPQLQLSDDGGNDVLNIGQSGGTAFFKTSDTDNDFQFRRSDNKDLMRLDMSTLRVGIGTTTPSQKLTVSGSIEVDDGNLIFDVKSGDTRGIDFDGDAAIRFDQDNNKLLIERTNGSGIPNQPIITIPTNTSDDLVATVDGDISSSGGIRIDNTSTSAFAEQATIKWAVFTGTLGNTNSTRQITHGITNGKKRIVSINVNVEVESGESTPTDVPDNSFLAGGGHFQDETVDNFEYQTWFDDSKVYLHVESSAIGIDNNRFTMIVHYTTADLY
jgi:hypothetical protein